VSHDIRLYREVPCILVVRGDQGLALGVVEEEHNMMAGKVGHRKEHSLLHMDSFLP